MARSHIVTSRLRCRSGICKNSVVEIKLHWDSCEFRYNGLGEESGGVFLLSDGECVSTITGST